MKTVIAKGTVLSRLRLDRRGSTGVIFAALATPAVFMLGLAIDYSRTQTVHNALQASLDAAALTKARTSDSTMVTKVFTANYSSGAMGTSAPTPAYSVDSNGKVTATASVNVPTTFASIMGVPSVTVGASSTATPGSVASTTTSNLTACVYALASSGTGVTIDSNGLLSANCGLQVNSSSSSAVTLSSNGKIKTTSNCVVGKISYDSNTSVTPSPATTCTAAADPLSTLAAPTEASGACTYTNKSIGGNSTTTLNPGVYCGGIKVDSNAKVTFNPGTYIIKNGPLQTSANNTLTGNGVFFYFTDTNANLFIDSNSRTTFTAPASGTYQGLLFVQDRTVSTIVNSQIDSGTSSTLGGVVYLPKTNMKLDSNGFALTYWTVWVVNTLDVDSNATLKIQNYDSSSSIPLPTAATTTSGSGKSTEAHIND